MAAIGITVTGDGYQVYLDQYEWTGLTVNDKAVEINDLQQYIFSQTGFDRIEFKAKGNLTATNPGEVFVMEGDENFDFICIITYNKKPFELNGVLYRIGKVSGAKSGPFHFFQGMMQGWFTKG